MSATTFPPSALEKKMKSGLRILNCSRVRQAILSEDCPGYCGLRYQKPNPLRFDSESMTAISQSFNLDGYAPLSSQRRCFLQVGISVSLPSFSRTLVGSNLAAGLTNSTSCGSALISMICRYASLRSSGSFLISFLYLSSQVFASLLASKSK